MSVFFHNSDRMAENMKQEVDFKDSEITSSVDDTCFVNIPEDQIKLENTEIKGNPHKFIYSLRIKAHCVCGGGRVERYL